jgi:hypothetical protein
MKKSLIIGTIVVTIGIGLFVYKQKQSQETTTPPTNDTQVMEEKTLSEESRKAMEEMEIQKDGMMKEMDDAMMESMKTMNFDFSGALIDVTKSQTIRATVFDGNSSGTAQSNFNESGYNLLVEFGNIPDPSGTDFYEGWIVRKSPFHVISTGKVTLVDGVYQNAYASGQNLSDHDFYVLTLEPDDNDPAPADHILEGTMTK